MSTAPPGPGIYEEVPFAEYLAWPYYSNSALHAAERSMLHFKHRQPIEETPAMRFGTLCHLGRLEPAAIFRRYVVMPDLSKGIVRDDGTPYDSPKATKQYKAREAKFREDHQDKLIVSQEDYDALTGVVSALDAHPLAHQWFTELGPVELSLVWDDPATGLRCKGRIDKWTVSRRIVVDLKTTNDCLRFPWQIADRHYHRQGAMYTDAIKVLTGHECQFGLVAVENVRPFGVMAAPVDEEAIAEGRERYREILRQIAESEQTNCWPGYSSPDVWTLPRRTKKPNDNFTLTIAGESVTL